MEFSSRRLRACLVIGALSLFAFPAAAHAQEGVQLSTTATDAPIGSSVTATTQLSGGKAPTGTLTFRTYTNNECGGESGFTSTVTVNGNGSYTSAPFTPTQSGRYWWATSYSGDQNNGERYQGCYPVQVISHITPALAITATSGKLGDAVSATATLAGSRSEGGNVTIAVYATSDCSGTPLHTDTLPANGDSSYTATAITPAHAGQYRWTASYDNQSEPASLDCAHAGISTIARVATTLAGAATGGTVGDKATDTATLSGGHAPTGTVTFKAWTTADCSGDPAFVSAAQPLGGAAAAFTPAAAGDYFWIAAYSGDVDNAPAATTCAVAGQTSMMRAANAIFATQNTAAPARLTLTGVKTNRCSAEGRNVTVQYRISTAAKISVSLERKVKPAPMVRRVCPGPLPETPHPTTFRPVKITSASISRSINASAGAHSVSVKTGKLAPGRYRVQIQATSADGQKAAAMVSFWILIKG